MSKRFVTILLVALAGIWLPARAELRVHIIDVGQAASAIVELERAAILIDAGGEDTGNDRDAKSIREALKALFARRTDLNNTLEAVIVSHPHKDHTRNLMTVMQGFTVKALVDNGDTNSGASGMPELKDARTFARSKNIPEIKVKDSDIGAGGKVLRLSPGAASSAEVILLSGFRNCPDENNDSIAVLVKDGNASALFAGDAEMEDASGTCRTEPQLQHLVKRFGNNGLLGAKLYHATHHGSHNGVLDTLMQKVRPAVSVISAGRLEPENRKPGGFHAFQFGHPRKVAIESLIANTAGTRPPVQAKFMTRAGNQPGVEPVTVEIDKAVYCTCWDGNLDISFAPDGEPRVEVLGERHAPGDDPVTRIAPQSCAIAPGDVFTPVIKTPDAVKQAATDYYMLALSWSPQFCSTSAGNSAANRFQCRQNSFGIVVHGLWPQSSSAQGTRDHPRNCKPTTPIGAGTLREHLCTVPGVQLQQDEWAKHGTCAFDSPENYLGMIEKLMAGLQVPDLQALAQAKGNSLKAGDVTGAFISGNPGLASSHVQLQLSGRNLQEVHVCYDLTFKFRKCDTTSTVRDTNAVTIRPTAP